MQLVDMRTSPPRHLWKTWQPRAGPITAVTIHHSATPPTQTIYSMAWYHVNTKDMPSIQYHYVVTWDGRVCWMVDDELLVWHGNGSNDYAVGVCLVGDFTHEHPHEPQLTAARELIAHLGVKHGRELDVIGHKEAPRAATTCPGETWDEWKGELAVSESDNLRAQLDGTGELATGLRWRLEEKVVRALKRADELEAEAERIRSSVRRELEAMVSTVDGLAYAVEVAAGRDAPKEWKGQS